MDPTRNLYDLLADGAEDNVPAAKPKPAKKSPAAGATSTPVGALTPAQKAAQRKAKPVAKKAPKKRGNVMTPLEGEEAPVPVQNDNRAPVRKGRGGRRVENSRPHGHQAPAHGREFDRKSGTGLSRKPQAKRGGAGKGNWGTPKDELSGKKDAAASEETPVVAEGEAAPVEPSEAAPEEEPDNTLAYDDFVKQQKEKAAALAAKLGTPVQEDIPAAETSSTAEEPSPATAGARKGAKAVNVAEVFTVKAVDDGFRRDNKGGRGRGGKRGGKNRPVDTKNTRQFPALGK